MEDPYGQEDPKFRQWLDRKIEEWCARPAKGVVTVSDPWAADYRRRWEKPVTVAYNGFDPDDVAGLDDVEIPESDKLKILYTGIIYPERRDPSPLFAALAKMDAHREKISVEFYGPNVAQLGSAVREYGQQDIVSLRPGIPFSEVLKLQRQADVLLLLQWNNPLEAGNVPGKLFEYLAARRPVLGIGFEQGVPARILSDRGAGRVLNDPEEIATYLSEILDQKTRNGRIPLLPESVKAGLSRPEQYGEIVNLFQDVAADTSSR
jgi:glycosyltransferase involved in cell wall biosynthesis